MKLRVDSTLDLVSRWYWFGAGDTDVGRCCLAMGLRKPLVGPSETSLRGAVTTLYAPENSHDGHHIGSWLGPGLGVGSV